MDELTPALPVLLVFIAASLVLAVTPGPGVFYIVTRSAAEGRKAGLASVLGVALGNLASAVGASLGLASIIATSAVAFEIVRYLGALYLFLLAWKAVRPRGPAAERSVRLPRSENARVLRDGFVVAVLNPKTMLFFAAFLPQFVVPGSMQAVQPLVLGLLFVLIAASTDTLYALFAALVSPYLSRASSAVSATRFAAGAAYFGLGVFAVLSGHRGDR